MFQRIDMDGGYVLIGSGINDVLVVSTGSDPVNLKFASLSGISLGAMSWGRLREDGNIEMKVLFQGKIAENTRLNPNIKDQGGEFTIHCHDGIQHFDSQGNPNDDMSMRLSLMARHDVVWVPRLVTAADMPGGLPGWSGPVPPAPPPPLPPAPPPTGFEYPPGTALIVVGDFAGLEAHYGFPCEERDDYANGKIPWVGPKAAGHFSILWDMERRAAPTNLINLTTSKRKIAHGHPARPRSTRGTRRTR